MLEAIYHPSYFPEINFYKTQLIIWDNIYRIVPYSVEDTFGSDKLAELWQMPKEYLKMIGFSMPESEYFEERKFAITNQLIELSKKKIDQYCEEDHFYLNTDKVPTWIGDVLLERGLRKKEKIKIWGARHYNVRKDASDFLMSCVAHKLSMDRGMSSLTDKKISCFMTYGNQIGKFGNKKPSGDNLQSLIVGIFDLFVPEGIEKLNFQEILKIREEYSELRKALVEIIEYLSSSFNIIEIIDEKMANEKIREAINKFNSDIDKFKKSLWRRIFKEWKTQSIATILGSLAGFLAGGPSAALYIGGAGSIITIINQIAGKEEPSKTHLSIQYFNEINRRIENNEFVEGLLNYRKFVYGER